MDWYFLEESDDFLVPSDQEPFGDVPAFSDDWRSWAVAPPKVSQPCGDDALLQHGRGLYADEMKQSAFKEGERGFGDSTARGESTPLDCCPRSSEESFECQTKCEMPDNLEEMDNIFLCKHNFRDPWNSFLEVDTRNMENAFEPVQMFPDSMYRSLSFENILATMLADPQNHSASLSRSESMNDLEACGIPLFPNDLSEDFEKTDDCSSSCVNMPDGSVILRAEDSDPYIFVPAEVRPTSESKLVAADAEKPKCSEATVLRELEDAILLLNEETRICFRDSLYRLASSSKDKKRKRDESRITETTVVASAPKMKGVSSRANKSECTETETNIIDRTVANLVFNQSFAGSSDAKNPVLAS
ncbi:uncharacterized protein LOC109709319 [Ananas comosus]|uniref:Uncharacterized protein LOC109709319 n=1 Tax=Ananas comosus TaxID=4615 RepID=A0A6P5F147_ANACO|nr:uncharacterized protein LOC109709319 [Ananas comosus]XP_020087085.1 uncharacterized protein LOC109709319 [Ananas comosus]